MKQSFAKFAFYWGSVFGGVVFLYQALSALLHFTGNFFQTLIYSLIVISSLIVVYTKYRRSNPSLSPGFGRSLGLLTLVSLTMSLFFALFTMVLIAKINPNLIQEALNQMEVLMDDYDVDMAIFEKEGMYKLLQVAFIFSNFIFDFIGNFFYCLLIAFVFTRNNTRRFEPYRNDNAERDRESEE